MKNVRSLYPSNDFKVVADNAKKEVEVGLIIGYSKDGEMCIYAGGLLDGKVPVVKDWLWLVESFKNNLINGKYYAE